LTRSSRILAGVAGALLVLTASGCARPRPNVLLVTLDTTRADHVGYATGKANITPNLDALAAKGTWFSHCITSQPLTMPAHATILTGLYPYRHGVRNNGTYVLPSAVETLAEMLRSAGYTTHAIVSAYVLDSQFGLDQGFGTYDDDLSGGPQQKMFMFKEIPAGLTAEKAVRWLRGSRPADRPFFLWLHFFDPHADYEPPADVAAKFPGELYQAEVAFVDREIGRVLSAIDDLGIAKNTLTVVTSDHGESLGEHGEKSHGIFIYDATARVPLLFAGPGAPRGRIDSVVRTADITPTILEIAGVKTAASFDGQPLGGLMRKRDEEGRTAYVESFGPLLNFGWAELRALRTAEGKAIQAPRPEWYELENDPAEKRNLLAQGAVPAAARPLLAQLARMARDDPFSRGEHQQRQLDSETARRLAALGYVTAPPLRGDAIRADPKDRIQHWERFQQAQALVRARSYEPAIEIIRDLLEVDRDNVIAMGSLANALIHTNSRDEALAIYRRMIELDPQRDSPYLGASRILREQRKFDEAKELAQAVIRMQPKNPEGYTAVGDVYLEQENFAEAETWFRRALQVDPHSSLAVTGLGNCLNRAGRLQEALEVLKAGKQADPTSQAIVYNLAVVVDRLGDRQGAANLYQEALRLDPDHSMSWNNLGSLLNRAGKRAEALRYVARARQLDPLNVEAAYNLGTLLLAAGQAEQALPHLNAALRLNPGFIAAAVQRAGALTALDRKPQALAAWRQLAPHLPMAYLQIARLELSLGREKEARAALKQAVAQGGPKLREAAEQDSLLRRLLPAS